MFAFFSRILGTVLSSLCLSIIPLFFLGLGRRTRRGSLLRRFLRFSYRLYAAFFEWLRPHLMYYTGFDLIHDPNTRTVASGALSMGLGWILLGIFHWQIGFWTGLFLLGHGLFIGSQWEQVETPSEFQMGGRIE